MSWLFYLKLGGWIAVAVLVGISVFAGMRWSQYDNSLAEQNLSRTSSRVNTLGSPLEAKEMRWKAIMLAAACIAVPLLGILILVSVLPM